MEENKEQKETTNKTETKERFNGVTCTLLFEDQNSVHSNEYMFIKMPNNQQLRVPTKQVLTNLAMEAVNIMNALGQKMMAIHVVDTSSQIIKADVQGTVNKNLKIEIGDFPRKQKEEKPKEESKNDEED